MAGLEIKNGDGILCAVADKQRLAGFIEGQRIRLRAEQVRRVLPRADGLSRISSVRVSITLKVSPPALATTSQRPAGDNASAQACRRVSRSEFGVRSFEFRSITDTEPSLAMERASTRTRMPSPAGGMGLSASGRPLPKFST